MDPASQARAIAARLAASLGTAQAPAAAPLPAAYTAAYGTAPAADDPVARARAIAAKLGLTMASAGTKRSLAEAFPTGSGDDQKVKRKIYIPVTAKGALIGPAVRAVLSQQQACDTGALILRFCVGFVIRISIRLPPGAQPINIAGRNAEETRV